MSGLDTSTLDKSEMFSSLSVSYLSCCLVLRAQRHEDWREAAPGARPQGQLAEADCTRITEASTRPGIEERRSLAMVRR